MLKLLLLRHGKSDWGSSFAADHDRPLAKRGVKAARQMGSFLAAAGEVPEAVLTSPALRARTTVDLAAAAGGWSCPVQQAPSLYGASPEDALALLQAWEGRERSLLLAGHEPTWSGLLSLLVGGGRFRFPTAAVAAVGFEVAGWAEVRAGAGELLWMVVPRLLAAAVAGGGSPS